MKVVKPQRLGLLSRCLEFKGRFRMGISALLHVPLGPQPNLFSEVSLWKLAAEQLGPDAVLDAAIPKALGEYLVEARAHPPQADAVACRVRASVAGHEKVLHVIGDRHWTDGGEPSQPGHVRGMRLDWSRAWGGPGVAENPLGKGGEGERGADARVLPNVEHPEHHVRERGDGRGRPAGFGPVDQTWPQRAARAGTYGDAWLQHDYPGFARDIDWRFFNVAPEDQWLPLPLATDLPYAFDHLHPTLPRLEGRLPGFDARCFVRRTRHDAHRLQAVPLRLATLWFFPHVERAILVYQGFCDIERDDGSDIALLLLAAEDSAAPRSDAAYAETLARRLDPEHGFLRALDDADLLPTGLAPDPHALGMEPAGEQKLEGKLRRRQEREVRRVREEVAGYGLDPDEHAPPMPAPPPPLPTLEELPRAIAEMEAAAQATRLEAERGLAKTMAETKQQFIAQGLDFAEIEAEIATRPSGPPTFSARKEVDAMQALADARTHDPLAVAELEGYSRDPAWVRRLDDAEASQRDLYRASAHLQDGPPPLPPAQAAVLRERVVQALQAGEPLGGIDLTRADLSGLDLSGADLAGAFLEGADLTGTVLVKANLAGAVLARTTLHRTDLREANLRGANLGHADGVEAVLDKADLSDAILTDASFARSSFRGATLERAGLLRLRLDTVDWRDTRAPGLLFIELDLRTVLFSGADLAGAAFLHCDLSGARLSRCDLSGAVLLAAKARKTRLRGATMRGVRCVERCDFTEADFTDADLHEGNLRDCTLAGARFIRARLTKADLSGAALAGAWFYATDASGSRLVRADLSGAVVVSTNLRDAILQQSTLDGADLRHSNLHQADLARATGNAGTRLDGVVLSRARTLPRAAERPLLP